MAVKTDESMVKQAGTLATSIRSSGKKALAFLFNGCEHTRLHGDWDHLAKFLHDLPESDESLARRYMRAYFGDRVLMKKDKGAKYGVVFKLNKPQGVEKWGDCVPNNFIAANWQDAIKRGDSWRSKDAMAEILPASQSASTFDKTKAFETFEKRLMDKAEMSLSDIADAMMKEATRLKAKAAAAKATGETETVKTDGNTNLG